MTKPKEGRGIADFFKGIIIITIQIKLWKGTAFDFGIWKMILKRVLIMLLGLLGSDFFKGFKARLIKIILLISTLETAYLDC